MSNYNHLNYERVCEFCGIPYIAHNKRSRFCSKLCKDRARHKLDKNPYKKICAVCGNEFETYREAAVCCSHDCTTRHKRQYKKKGRDPRYNLTWDEYTAKRKAETEERRIQRSKLKNLWPLIEMIEESFDKECANCGEIFHSKYQGAKFCSDDCRRHFRNHLKDRRIPKDRIIDKDITVEKLFIRDEGKCWICGGYCNWEDKQVSNSGYEYAGYTYPTKDHVIPIARGGFESWDNVRLAHWKCNCLEKKDNLYPYVPMDVAFAYSVKGNPTPGKKTAQYSLDGKLIKIWPSTGQIERELGLKSKHIQNVCRHDNNNTGNAYGYHWEYLEEAII